MSFSGLNISQVKDMAATVGYDSRRETNDAAFMHLIGKNTIVRTVTMIYTGRLVSVHPTELVMVDVAWIPETERYMQFVLDGAVRECEPYPDGLLVTIGRGALLDAVELRAPLLRKQK